MSYDNFEYKLHIYYDENELMFKEKLFLPHMVETYNLSALELANSLFTSFSNIDLYNLFRECSFEDLNKEISTKIRKNLKNFKLKYVNEINEKSSFYRSTWINNYLKIYNKSKKDDAEYKFDTYNSISFLESPIIFEYPIDNNQNKYKYEDISICIEYLTIDKAINKLLKYNNKASTLERYSEFVSNIYPVNELNSYSFNSKSEIKKYKTLSKMLNLYLKEAFKQRFSLIEFLPETKYIKPKNFLGSKNKLIPFKQFKSKNGLLSLVWAEIIYYAQNNISFRKCKICNQWFPLITARDKYCKSCRKEGYRNTDKNQSKQRSQKKYKRDKDAIEEIKKNNFNSAKQVLAYYNNESIVNKYGCKMKPKTAEKLFRKYKYYS